MKTILQIDSSILGEYSVSRGLTADIVSKLKELHPGSKVIQHDVASKPALHLSDAHLAAFKGGKVDSTSLNEDLEQGTSYLDDLFAADFIVIGAPMYNFSIPSQLKSWVDRVSVAGKTFSYTSKGPEGLVIGKKAYIASTRGGIHSEGSPSAGFDHQETYIRDLLAFIGITDITIIRAEGVNISPEMKTSAIAHAKSQIEAIN
jgi:FMN-dependent NADH-azoreductase